MSDITNGQMDTLVKFGLSVNLDEITSELLTVAFCEYDDDPENPGKQVKRWRHVEIDSEVSMDLFNIVLKEQQTKGDAFDTFEWMSSAVLKVWKRTEPDMTRERLMNGLDYKKTIGLFMHFFGDLMESMV